MAVQFHVWCGRTVGIEDSERTSSLHCEEFTSSDRGVPMFYLRCALLIV